MKITYKSTVRTLNNKNDYVNLEPMTHQWS